MTAAAHGTGCVHDGFARVDCDHCQIGAEEFARLADRIRQDAESLGCQVYVNSNARVLRVHAPVRGRLVGGQGRLL